MRIRHGSAISLITALIGLSPAFGQTPLPSMSLDVKPLTSGGQSHSTGGSYVETIRDPSTSGVIRTEKGGSLRSKSTIANLEISVRNFRAVEQEVVVRTFFLAKNPTGGSFFYLVGKIETPLKVPASGSAKTTATSARVGSSTERKYTETTSQNSYSSTTSSTASGANLYGWIVEVVANGRPVVSRGSNLTLEATAHDPSGLDAILGQPAKPPPAYPQ